ncbi:hypothetical protein B0H11DRAFT_2194424, partial [Mycena galericulata]
MAFSESECDELELDSDLGERPPVFSSPAPSDWGGFLAFPASEPEVDEDPGERGLIPMSLSQIHLEKAVMYAHLLLLPYLHGNRHSQIKKVGAFMEFTKRFSPPKVAVGAGAPAGNGESEGATPNRKHLKGPGDDGESGESAPKRPRRPPSKVVADTDPQVPADNGGEATPNRKRGPPKANQKDLANDEESNEPALKRRRGRPPKVAIEVGPGDDGESGQSAPKRARGRPFKGAAGVDPQVPADGGSEEATPNRQRGRPAKANREHHANGGESDEPALKRRRGRPPKVPIEVGVEGPSDDGEIGQPAPDRARGRPPKVAADAHPQVLQYSRVPWIPTLMFPLPSPQFPEIKSQ